MKKYSSCLMWSQNQSKKQSPSPAIHTTEIAHQRSSSLLLSSTANLLLLGTSGLQSHPPPISFFLSLSPPRAPPERKTRPDLPRSFSLFFSPQRGSIAFNRLGSLLAEIWESAFCDEDFLCCDACDRLLRLPWPAVASCSLLLPNKNPFFSCCDA